jgi:hypothetical protein
VGKRPESSGSRWKTVGVSECTLIRVPTTDAHLQPGAVLQKISHMPINKGPREPKGKQGALGERGPAGPRPSRGESLRAVEEQLGDIRQQLDIQLTRFGQLQAQLDHIETLLKQLVQVSPSSFRA